MKEPQNFKSAMIALLVVILLLVVGTVSAQQTQFASPILVVNTSFLNVRTGPSVEFTILVTVVGGTELPVLGVANDKVWYQVATDAGPGWVNVKFTLPRGDFTRVPFASVDEPAPASLGQGGGGGGGSPTGSRIWGLSTLGGDFRSAPSDKATIISAMLGTNLSEIYPILSYTINEGRGWFATTLPGIGSGWNEAHQFKVRPMACAGETVVVITTEGAVGRGPDIGSDINRPVFEGEEYYVLDVRSGLVKLEFWDGAAGWLDIEKTRGRDDSGLVKFCGNAPRAGSSGGSSTSSSAPGGTTPAITAPARVVINTGNLNIRSGPSAGFSIVATVPGGTELAIVGRAADGVWYLVEGSFGQGWLNNEFVVFRGSYAAVPVVSFP